MVFGRSRKFRQYLESKWLDLYRVAFSWTHDRDTAADLVQETITRCLKNHSKFNSEDDLRPWLFKVMTNCWRDQLRKEKDTMDYNQLNLDATTDIEHEHYINALIGQVNHALNTLSHEQQETLSLVVIEGLSYDEVARTLDVPVGTVMSRISRARIKLRESMKDIDVNLDKKPFLWRVK